jgi:hypothetical protein
MDVNIHQAGGLKVTVKEFRRSDGTAQFDTLAFRDYQDTVTMFFPSLVELEGLVERIQAAVAARIIAPVLA